MALRLQGRHCPRSPVTAHLGASKHPLCKAARPDPRPWGEVSALWAALLGLTDQQRSPGAGLTREQAYGVATLTGASLGTALEKSLRSVPLPGQSCKQGVWWGPGYRAGDALTGGQVHTALSTRGHVHSRWSVEWRGVGAQAREAQALRGGMGRGRALPAEPPMRLGPAFQRASLGALPSHALWLDRLMPGGGSGPQMLPQLLAPGCKPLRGPTIRWLGGSSRHLLGSSGGAAGLGPGASLRGSGWRPPKTFSPASLPSASQVLTAS